MFGRRSESEGKLLWQGAACLRATKPCFIDQASITTPWRQRVRDFPQGFPGSLGSTLRSASTALPTRSRGRALKASGESECI